MKGRILRVLILLWLGWYIWGPLDPVVDFWDSPRQTMSDMVRQAGGTVVLVAAAFALAPLQVSRMRDHFRRSLRVVGSVVVVSAEPAPTTPSVIPAQPIHAPPVPLRI